MGMIQKQGNWVPYEPRDVERRFFTCEQLIQRHREKVFCIGLWLKIMRSGYSTTTPRKKNTTLSPINRCHRLQHQHHGRTFMVRRLCFVSGGTKRVLFTISWNFAILLWAIGIGYNWFVWAVREKRLEYEQKYDEVSLLHDNARPHITKVVKIYLEMLKWDVLPHPSYSPDIAPSDYWLFRRMQQVWFTSFAEIENWLQNWIASKDYFFEMEFENCLRDGKK